MDEALCTLQYSVGRVERCPGARCPFWAAEPGATIGHAGCVLAPLALEVTAQPGLAQHLLELRRELERTSTTERSLFYRLLDEEQEAEGQIADRRRSP